jgi:hypothetical protein
MSNLAIGPNPYRPIDHKDDDDEDDYKDEEDQENKLAPIGFNPGLARKTCLALKGLQGRKCHSCDWEIRKTILAIP